MRHAGNVASGGHGESTMQFRALAPALAAALVILGCPALAADQAAPTPSTSPDPVASVAPSAASSAAPSADASIAPSAEPTAAPSDQTTPAPQPSTARSLRGTLMSVKGTLATVKMANGTVQTYTVSTKVAAALKKSLGKKLLFRVVHGALDVIPH
jgi:hypothetical protein